MRHDTNRAQNEGLTMHILSQGGLALKVHFWAAPVICDRMLGSLLKSHLTLLLCILALVGTSCLAWGFQIGAHLKNIGSVTNKCRLHRAQDRVIFLFVIDINTLKHDLDNKCHG